MLFIVTTLLLGSIWATKLFPFLPLLPFLFVTREQIRSNNIVHTPIKPFLLFFIPVALSALSITWSIAPDASIDRTLKIAPLFILGGFLLCQMPNILNHFNKDENDTKYLSFLLGILIFLTTTLAIEHHFNMPIMRFLTQDYDAPFSIHHYNKCSAMLTLSSPPIIWAGLKERQTPLLIILALSSFAMFLTLQSQSAQLAIIIGLIACFIPWSWRLFHWGIFLNISLFSLLSPYIFTYLFKFSHNIDQLQWSSHASIAARIEIGDAVSNYIFNSPLWGHGIEATNNITDFVMSYMYQTMKFSHPHNASLQIWIEFGLLGYIIFIAVLYLFFRKILQTYKGTSLNLAFTMICMWFSLASTGYGLWHGWWIALMIFNTMLFQIMTHMFLSNETASQTSKN